MSKGEYVDKKGITWEEMILRSAHYENKKKSELNELIKRIRRLMTIPIVIGVLAAILLWLRHGYHALEEAVLSWTIGMTLIGTLIASAIGKIKK